MAKKSSDQELLAKLGPTLKIKIDPKQLTGDHVDYPQVAEVEVVNLVSSEEEEEECGFHQAYLSKPIFPNKHYFSDTNQTRD